MNKLNEYIGGLSAARIGVILGARPFWPRMRGLPQRFMYTAALVIAILLSWPARAQGTPDAQAERRAPSAAESESFKAFHGASQVAALPAVFDIVRSAPKGPWQVSAMVDGAAYRGAGALCRMTQNRYAYDARAAAGQRWRLAGQKRFAWLDRAGCGEPARRIELAQRIPDAALAPLIAGHGVLLLRARLLFSGNTSCAPYRSLRYRLTAVDVSAPPHGKEELYALVFDSEGAGRAHVWIKQRGAELNAWDVACSDSAAAAQ